MWVGLHNFPDWVAVRYRGGLCVLLRALFLGVSFRCFAFLLSRRSRRLIRIVVHFRQPIVTGRRACFFFRKRLHVLELHLRHLLELVHRGQFLHVLQPETQQKFLGRLVQNRSPDHLLAPRRRDELARQQRPEHTRRLDAANLIHFRRRHGLLVGDHREGLQGRQTQLHSRLQALHKHARRVVALRLGRHAVATGNLLDFNTPVVAGVGGNQLVQQPTQNRPSVAIPLPRQALFFRLGIHRFQFRAGFRRNFASPLFGGFALPFGSGNRRRSLGSFQRALRSRFRLGFLRFSRSLRRLFEFLVFELRIRLWPAVGPSRFGGCGRSRFLRRLPR